MSRRPCSTFSDDKKFIVGCHLGSQFLYTYSPLLSCSTLQRNTNHHAAQEKIKAVEEDSSQERSRRRAPWSWCKPMLKGDIAVYLPPQPRTRVATRGFRQTKGHLVRLLYERDVGRCEDLWLGCVRTEAFEARNKAPAQSRCVYS